MALMRARHEVFGVKDVADTQFNRNNGWTPVDPSTPTTEQERRQAVNAVRRGEFDPAEHKAAEVAAVVAAAPEGEKKAILSAEKSGKARKSVLESD